MTSDAGAHADDFDGFYRREFAPMVRLATLLTGQRELARDIVQESLIDLHDRWAQIDVPQAYLRRSVINAANGFLRSPRNWRHVPLDEHDQHHEVAVSPRVDHTFAVLATLNPRERACVVLKFYGGHTEREIAHLIDCPPGSVGPTIRRALDKLRPLLDDTPPEQPPHSDRPGRRRSSGEQR